MANVTTKVGFLCAPCTIRAPTEQGAKAVIKVKSIKRDDNTTTLIGERVMGKVACQLELPNYVYVEVL